MTSKEALEILLVGYYNNANYQEVIEAREKLEKDLEVLDILKKWVLVNETYDDLFPYEIKLRNGYVSNRSCLVFTKDDYEKVKEWLEDEKDKI